MTTILDTMEGINLSINGDSIIFIPTTLRFIAQFKLVCFRGIILNFNNHNTN